VGLHPLAMHRPFSVPTAIGKQTRGHRAAYRLHVKSHEPREAPITGLTSFAPRAYVIDMGQATQTAANSVKPYGMVHALVENQHISVDRSINPNNAACGAEFRAGSKWYSVGSFVIEAPFATAAESAIARRRAQRVVVNEINTAFAAPIDNTTRSLPRTPRFGT
jgi:hypothetical protein